MLSFNKRSDPKDNFHLTLIFDSSIKSHVALSHYGALFDNVQIQYPDNVYMIRGNHEAPEVNKIFGFRVECIERMV